MATTKIRKGQLENLQIIDADIATDAAIATSKLAEGSKFVKKDVTNIFSTVQDLGNNKIQNLGAPSNANDAARLVDVQNAQAGLSSKEAVRAVSIINIASLSGLTSIDNVSLVAGERVLLTGQTTKTQNGIWLIQSTAWTRPEDFNGTDVKAGSYIFVTEGTIYGDTGWLLSSNGIITVDTTNIDFFQFTGAAQIITGNGLVKNGNEIYIGASTTLTVGADTIELKAVGTAGTFFKTTIDAYGRVTAGTNPTTLAGFGITDAQASNVNLTALAGIATNGFIARTGAGALATRSLTQGAGVVITNGDGVSGNPTIALATSGVVAGTYNSVTVDTYGRVTAASNTSVLINTNYIINEIPTGAINSTNTVFTLVNAPVAGKEQVFLNGILQESGAGNDYTISGNTITFLIAPLTGDKVRISYIK